MAKFTLTDGFTLIPEGTHVFKITKINYKEDFGKMEVTMETERGQTHTERFSLLTASGETNSGAMNAFSYFAKVALNDFSRSEIDSDELVGHYMRCEVLHEKVESNRTPGKKITFVKLGDKESADGFDGEEIAAPKENKKSLDLNSLLG